MRVCFQVMIYRGVGGLYVVRFQAYSMAGRLLTELRVPDLKKPLSVNALHFLLDLKLVRINVKARHTPTKLIASRSGKLMKQPTLLLWNPAITEYKQHRPRVQIRGKMPMAAARIGRLLLGTE